jgi:hypothetical protein
MTDSSCRHCPTDASTSLADTVLAPEATEVTRPGTVSDPAMPGEVVGQPIKKATRRPPILGDSKAAARTTARWGSSTVVTNDPTNETLRLH